jgi:hypothetical protein
MVLNRMYHCEPRAMSSTAPMFRLMPVWMKNRVS